MPEQHECPSVEQLKQLAVGRLPDPPAGSLEEHLLECEECAQQTAQLHQADTLLVAMKQAGQTQPERSPEEVARLERLMSSLSGLHVEATILSNPQGPSVATRDAADVTRELSAAWRAPEDSDELGRIGGYRILKVLGAGGMGGVFLAEDLQLRRRVALKLMRPRAASAPGAAERFLREARAAAALRHDHIITIYQVDEDAGVPFLAMELLEGESLEDRLRREPTLPVNEVLRIGREIAEGLAAAHAKGLVHRDIKPANVWLERRHQESSRHAPRDEPSVNDTRMPPEASDASTEKAHHAERDGYFESTRVKLLDFGLARSVEAETQLTSSGMIVGTPSYMAPEQASGEPVDGRVDLFSLGVVLYRMTTGQLPFPGKKVMEILKALATVTPASPRSLNPAVPQELSDVIDRLLTKDREQRPASALLVARQLSEIEHTCRMGTPARPALVVDEKRTGRSAHPTKRVTVVLAGLAALVLLAVVIVTITTKDGKKTEIAVNVPGEVKSVTTDVKGSPARLETTKTATGRLPVATEPSPFDALDPAAIPAAERLKWQPKELVAVLGSHRQRMWGQGYSVALSGDGAWAVAVGEWSPPLLIDVVNGGEAEIPSRVNCFFALSPDGRMLFWKGGDAVGLMVKEGDSWNARELPLPRQFNLNNQLNDATFSMDGRWLTTSVLHEVVENVGRYSTFVWDVSVNPPKLLIDLPGHKHPSLSSDSQRLAVLDTKDGLVEVFDVSVLPAKPVAVLTNAPLRNNWQYTVKPQFGFLANGMLATIDRASVLAVWDVSAAEPKVVAQRSFAKATSFPDLGVTTLRPFRSGEPRFVLFSQNEFVTWRLSGDTVVPEFRSPNPNQRWTNHNIHDVAVSQDGRTLASTHLNGMVRLWEVTESGFREKHPILQQPVVTGLTSRVIQMAPDGRHFATRSEDGFQLWRLNGATCQPLACGNERFDQQYGPVGFVGSQHFLTTGNGVTRRWKIDGDQAVHVGRVTDELLFPTAASGGGLILGLQWGGAELSLWMGDSPPAKRLCVWPAAPKGRTIMIRGDGTSGLLAISADERTLATVDHVNATPTMIRIWRRNDDDEPPTDFASFSAHDGPNSYPVYAIALTRDGTRIAVAAHTGLSLWKLDGDKPERLWHKHGYWLSVAFTPDDQQLAASLDSASESVPSNVMLFKLTGESQTVWNFPRPPSDLAFAPDRRHLLTANTNGTLYVLRIKPTDR